MTTCVPPVQERASELDDIEHTLKEQQGRLKSLQAKLDEEADESAARKAALDAERLQLQV